MKILIGLLRLFEMGGRGSEGRRRGEWRGFIGEERKQNAFAKSGIPNRQHES